MKGVQKRARRGRSYWERIIKDQESSGEVVKEYCEMRDIGVGSFYAWCRRLRLDRELSGNSSEEFVELCGKCTTPGPSLSVRYGEFSIEVGDEFDDEILHRVLDVVRSAALGGVSSREFSGVALCR